MRESFYAEYFRVEDRHWWFVGRRKIVLGLLADRLDAGAAGGRRVLDLGCGTGTMLGHLRRFGAVEGIDADQRAIEFCRARGEDSVRLLESDRLPFADETFDLVTALDVLEHIEDDQAIAAEIERVLKPRGVLLATVPANPWMWGAQDEISHHFRRYRARQLRRTLSDGRLEVERLTHFNTVLFPPVAGIRGARRILHRPGRYQRSDFEMTKAGRVNDLLGAVFASEAGWLRHRDLPFGVSLLCVATKRGN